jgi:hypothetical protein
MRIPIFLAILATVTGGPALAKECRIHNPAPGGRAQLPPGCKEPARQDRFEAARQEYVKGNQGFIDLGNGTQVRIGGRVRAEVGVRP